MREVRFDVSLLFLFSRTFKLRREQLGSCGLEGDFGYPPPFDSLILLTTETQRQTFEIIISLTIAIGDYGLDVIGPNYLRDNSAAPNHWMRRRRLVLGQERARLL